MEEILQYFPELTARQKEQAAALKSIYDDWNSKINLISRKDMDNFYQHHVLHSLAIAKVVAFENGTSVLDVGTGGGFPGIPLAILFPHVDFVLIDSIGKKIKVVNDVVQQLELNNVEAIQIRAEQLGESFDFVVSRAVTDLNTFYEWVKYKIRKRGFNQIRNGILYLKGGNLQKEIVDTGRKAKLYPIEDIFPLPYFDEKYVIHLF
ncbi:MAG: 16S rRNA (guanine(527)-N(7))-methyltransferase RsmG [Bacteroidales bacterium]|jgi:16S rRNA (guanine527-N7)-methyltransferase|nr:16S rRNA (guanine(527)-N(7))-methyltransferase RsmG [Bacteroidales bacterium]